jgi:hypothetical protein
MVRILTLKLQSTDYVDWTNETISCDGEVYDLFTLTKTDRSCDPTTANYPANRDNDVFIYRDKNLLLYNADIPLVEAYNRKSTKTETIAHLLSFPDFYSLNSENLIATIEGDYLFLESPDIEVRRYGNKLKLYDTVNESFWYKSWHSRLALANKTQDEDLKNLLLDSAPRLVKVHGWNYIKLANDVYNFYGQYVGGEWDEEVNVAVPSLPWLRPMQFIYCEPAHNEDPVVVSTYCDKQVLVCDTEEDNGLLTVKDKTCNLYFDLINDPYWYKDNFSKLVLADKMEEEGKQGITNLLRKSCQI